MHHKKLRWMMQKGTFVLSIDTELAWGFVHQPLERHPNHQFEHVRHIVDRLLRLMERYEIRATWAVVGHLLLDRCRPVDGKKHPEIARGTYSWLGRDWLEPDPCGNIENNPFWYGPDIMDAILTCSVPQEIGCHTFSHVFADDPGCSKGSLESELDACRVLATEKAIDLRSFVFPQNRVNHIEVLARKGFTAYRGTQHCWYKGFRRPLWSIAYRLDTLLPVSPLTIPERRSGIWNFPASYYYLHRDGWGKRVPVWLRAWKANNGLRRAANHKALFHMWFHPYNLATDMEGLFGGLEQIFVEVNRLRDKGLLENPTMGDLADRLNKAEE